eukprot:CAMPEP_0113990100 /NCGR_PEP_ID=MMETSP0328-20130328/8383_1 /TAXON_ID=39455 /ORGANISM="Alexandrium minutum" /LENGTH=38 /assembly_acc=CAM_ASM_000350
MSGIAQPPAGPNGTIVRRTAPSVVATASLPDVGVPDAG